VWKMIVVVHPLYHTYPIQQPPDAEDKDAVVTLRRPKYVPFVFVGEVISPEGQWGTSQGKRVKLIEGTAEWEWRFVVHPDAKPGKYKVKPRGNLLVCDERSCLNGDPPEAEFEILDGAPVPVEEK